MGRTVGQERLVIVAILTLESGAVETFREYETRAAVIIARHGGSIERTIIEETSAPGKPSVRCTSSHFPV